MSEQISLKNLERSLYKTSTQVGIIEVQLGTVFLIFAIGPLLSVPLGDFWASVVLLPFWILIIVGPRVFRKQVLLPRIGMIEYSTFRKKRLSRLNLVILVLNILALFLGVVAFFQFPSLGGWVVAFWLAITILVSFSLAGYLMEYNRLYLYGVLAASAAMIGEYLYQNFKVSHHGYPVTFGILSAALFITGISIITRVMINHPLPVEEQPE
jgi:MFS family permease